MATFTTSAYIKKEQIKEGTELHLTISAYAKEEVKNEDEVQQKWVLSFEEIEEKLILNKSRGEAIAAATGSFEMDDWIGKRIALYNDPTVKFGGKKVGGLAVRETLVA